MRVICVVARKATLGPGLRTPEGLYSAAFDPLVREAMDAHAPYASLRVAEMSFIALGTSWTGD
jgi:hypothetical protein